ncbi:MAG TPA: hypothetical protein VES67_17745 [Vicinamibacterales bacterium]|nr:hypothetical protein [Vicinamibacterales bacterium]
MVDVGHRPGQRRWRTIAGALVILLGARAFYLFVQHLRGVSLRYHAEAAAVWFVLAGVLLVLSLTRDREQGPQVDQPSLALPATALWFAFVLTAFTLYWPTVGIGLLSDDFLLWDRAESWNLSPVSSGLFRPLPLLVWAMLINAGATAVALHMFNILLHGTNAYLTTRLCAGWLGAGTATTLEPFSFPRRAKQASIAGHSAQFLQPARYRRMRTALAGALMLALPLASEPVSWASGVFDLSMTALALLFVIRGRMYDDRVTLTQRVVFVVIGVCAMGAKETGVMACLLVLIDAWIRRKLDRRLLTDAVVVLAIAASFSAIRILGAFGFKSPSLTRYRVQRSLFETFGGLSVPFHADVVQQLSWLTMIAVLIVIALFVWYFVAAGSRSDRFVFGGAAWIAISVLPVFLFVSVGQDLQGARFLYLAGPAWSSLVAGLAISSRGVARRVTVVAIIVLAALWAVAVRVHLAPWSEAASLRDRVLEAARTDQQIQRCRTVALKKLPDNIRGAYVLRNGAPEALLREAGLRVMDDATPPCRFEWSEPAQAFIRGPE